MDYTRSMLRFLIILSALAYICSFFISFLSRETALYLCSFFYFLYYVYEEVLDEDSLMQEDGFFPVQSLTLIAVSLLPLFFSWGGAPCRVILAIDIFLSLMAYLLLQLGKLVSQLDQALPIMLYLLFSLVVLLIGLWNIRFLAPFLFFFFALWSIFIAVLNGSFPGERIYTPLLDILFTTLRPGGKKVLYYAGKGNNAEEENREKENKEEKGKRQKHKNRKQKSSKEKEAAREETPEEREETREEPKEEEEDDEGEVKWQGDHWELIHEKKKHSRKKGRK